MGNSVRQRAIDLLGAGVKQEIVATAIGVTPGRISQLLEDETFIEKVNEKRAAQIQDQVNQDAAYDAVEKSLVEKLQEQVEDDLFMTPNFLLRAIKIVNGARRRNQIVPDTAISDAAIVNLTLPINIACELTTTSDNQVVRTGTQDLITIQASSMQKLLDEQRS